MGFNEMQRKVAEHDKEFGWVGDRPEETVIHMQEELGEIAREMLRRAGYKKEKYDPQKVNDEISDLLYLTLKLGNLLELNLDEGWEKIGRRYEPKKH
jgi:NTP pyrophosphatase (non-canonical NTP hydrolase)